MTDFYHLCFAVSDLETAMKDLTNAGGIDWNEPRAGTLGDWAYRIVFSRSQPHIELIEGAAGSPWDTTAGAHFHHLGWWTQSLSGSAHQLTAHGMPASFDGCPYGRSFAYHRVESIGASIEIVDAEARSAFLSTWNPSGSTMPALHPEQPSDQGTEHDPACRA